MTAPAASGGDPGTVYLIHLDVPYKHARHYMGWTTNLAARLEAHANGRGARLMEVIMAAGITWRLARTWPGDRARERAIKNWHNAPKLCPECSPHPHPASGGRAGIAVTAPAGPSSQARGRSGDSAGITPRVTPYDRGVRAGEQFLRFQAGRTLAQMEAAYEYITGPYRAAAHHTVAQAELHRGYTDVITRQLSQLRAAEHAAAAATSRTPEGEAAMATDENTAARPDEEVSYEPDRAPYPTRAQREQYLRDRFGTRAAVEHEQEAAPQEMYVPDTPWARQDTTPRPVPDRDADGRPWQVTGDGRHVGTHNGNDYCLEWLPHDPPRRGDFGRDEGLELEAGS